ncbi:hypothetical protein CBS115989_5369 [Aspergillus niger]|uniref:Contig An16c0020, genomic contig n=4 Tax=Aspergillus TaxID=5052 RepID=A2R6Q5_ASPNC|nr:uncharacterized protein An16g00840 [Aspergillus niger]RDH18280.1 hypothetical protein M747DRAFT_297399 [Aspergillus niger ATCC 13496]RDK38339.1 hypothetical protein M752DRAFT_338925 [Aspergillus phoenicis ATCC 13157]KAI2818255.1 hypothetical protein CBS115989_5369 [Aspergillus niger]KAI2854187.1 hypothetical protein CBS11232_5036 [Aspergillus niger]KAI2875552.1 hypothetical protein CBS115988_5387 [Aspergillus niger]|eukprot:XP_001397397.1 hypothetical protein ANI_1_1392144 [Aspergillus niger CBS 513.88]
MPAAGGLTGGHPPSVRSRNIAIFSVIGMIAGGWMFFRAQSPSKEEKLYSQKDIHTMVGGQTGENRVGRAPSHQKKD